MTVSILGCGWYGKALGQSLIARGFTIKGSVTSDDKAAQLSALGIMPFLVEFLPRSQHFDPDFFVCDILIVSIPLKFKIEVKDGYLSKISRIVEAVLGSGIKKIIYISSSGVYGEQNREVTESDSPDPDTEQGKILLRAEQLFQNNTRFITTVIRFGGLVGPGRHPGRFFAGKSNIPNGRAPVNLMHLDDCIGISMSIIEQDAFGYVINAVTPNHPAKSEFYRMAALQAKLPAPGFADELVNWKIVNSAVIPGLLNYEFKVKDWKSVRFEL